MENYIRMRMREFLINYLGFVEVDTPTLFRSTPDGAQEFAVPTRKPGHFYSLLQSPQHFQQKLMDGAINGYFQIARGFCDEAKRQPEFTQLGIELSSTTRDEILNLIEELLRYSWPRDYPKITIPFKRMTYKEALEKYGTDKPDTRFGYLLTNVTDIVSKNEAIKEKYSNLGAYCIIVRAQEAFWNDNAEKRYESLGKEFEGTLFVRKFAQYKDVLESLTDHLTIDVAQSLIENLILEEQDLIFLAFGQKKDVLSLMGRIRMDYHDFLIENGKTEKCHENCFLWVIDYPMFRKNPVTGEFESVHHPFTAPHADDIERFNNVKSDELESVRSLAYELVLNGEEIGVGSIRIHDRDMQNIVLEHILKIPHEHLDHLRNSLKSGCPPHGSIALVIDRLLAIICRASSIGDVIEFPKSLNGCDPVSNVPVPISEEDKKLYNIAIVEEAHAETSMTRSQEDDDPDKVRSSQSPLPAPTLPLSTKGNDLKNGIKVDENIESKDEDPIKKNTEVGTAEVIETVTKTEDVPTVPKTPENEPRELWDDYGVRFKNEAYIISDFEKYHDEDVEEAFGSFDAIKIALAAPVEKRNVAKEILNSAENATGTIFKDPEMDVIVEEILHLVLHNSASLAIGGKSLGPSDAAKCSQMSFLCLSFNILTGDNPSHLPNHLKILIA